MSENMFSKSKVWYSYPIYVCFMFLSSYQITIGATSFNGQRCTAIKLVMVHESLIEQFLPKLKARISALKAGWWLFDRLFVTFVEVEMMKFLCYLPFINHLVNYIWMIRHTDFVIELLMRFLFICSNCRFHIIFLIIN